MVDTAHQQMESLQVLNENGRKRRKSRRTKSAANATRNSRGSPRKPRRTAGLQRTELGPSAGILTCPRSPTSTPPPRIRTLLMPFAFLLCVLGLGEMGWRRFGRARRSRRAPRTIIVVADCWIPVRDEDQQAFIEMRSKFTTARDAKFVQLLSSRIQTSRPTRGRTSARSCPRPSDISSRASGGSCSFFSASFRSSPSRD